MFNYIEPCFNFIHGEIWKYVDGYDDLYQISNYGRVISLWNKPFIKELKPQLDKDGYHLLTLYNKKSKKIFKLHRLVAQTFIPNPNNYPEINHKNEIKIDNRENNLEWCEHKYNINYGTNIERRLKTIYKK